MSKASGRVWVPALLLAAASVTGVVTYRLSLLANSYSANPPIALHVDLERGVAWTPSLDTLKFARRRLDLTCYLPAGSPKGIYRARLSRDQGEFRLDLGLLRSFAARFGEALPLSLDARPLPFGDYTLELRQAGAEPLRYAIKIVP